MKQKTNILRGARVTMACVFLFGLTLMLCDFTGATHAYLGWMAKIQLLPAILSIGAGATALGLIITALIIFVTLLFGRVYCSVICPMGIIQDTWAWWASLKWQKKISKRLGRNRYRFRKENKALRYGILAAFVALMLFPATAWMARLIAPYSAYARIAQSIFAPLYALCNNGLAAIAEHYGSYAFYSTEVWIKSGVTLGIALGTLVLVKTLALARGRWWCNNICPVGTMLGTLSRHAMFRPVIDTDKCNGCGKCGKNCKAECIDTANHTIDTSRCVDCFDCIGECSQGAISFSPVRQKSAAKAETVDESRRKFMGIMGGLAVTGLAHAQHKVDGGLAVIEKKQVPARSLPLKPAGSVSQHHFASHCTACQLCVSACPQQVLRPSDNLMTLMQPEMQYDKGYCLTGCTRCADVCPTGAIRKIDKAEKTAIQIGHAVWLESNCVVLSDGVECGNCARHCPTGAIMMVDKDGHKIPAINTEKCIGCGHCEYVCPSRPLSAIYVEGHDQQRTI